MQIILAIFIVAITGYILMVMAKNKDDDKK